MSLRRAGSLLLVLALAACKSVTQEPQPADLVFATFSSPTIPTPNDLALAQVPGGLPCTAMPDGQAQLLCTFVKAGGFPSDQEVPISIPVNAVHWSATATAEFPYGHYAAAAPPTIDLGTVTDGTVTILRVDVSPPAAVAFNAVATPGLLTLRKKSDANGRRWDAGARYVVAVRGGPSGVKTTTGLPLNADTAVALVIPDKDLTNPANQPMGAIPDANHDGTNADEIASLEALRAATWRPLTWSNATGGWAPGPSAAVTPAFTGRRPRLPARRDRQSSPPSAPRPRPRPVVARRRRLRRGAASHRPAPHRRRRHHRLQPRLRPGGRRAGDARRLLHHRHDARARPRCRSTPAR